MDKDAKIVAEQFRADGYAIVRGVFSNDEIAEIKRQIADFIRDVVPQLQTGDGFFEALPAKPIKSIFRLHDHSEFFKNLMADERLLSIMCEIYSGADVVQAETAFFGKAARSGSLTPPHQDTAFQNLVPPEDLVCTIALDESTPENGVLTAQKGSHKLGLLPHRPSGVLLQYRSSLSRRLWLREAGMLGIGAAASTLGHSTAQAAEISDLTFRQNSNSAPWSTRYGLGCVVFQDRLWVLGGTVTLHDGTQTNDGWSSEDGSNWRQETASAPWTPRWGHAVFAFVGKLWVIGGLASVEPIRNLNDIWSSPDGKKWTCVFKEAPWPARHAWTRTVHRGRMYLLGGASDGTHYYQDVISSDDGARWRLETIQGPWFEKRKTLAAASYRDQIFLSGGSVIEPSPHMLNDCWSSDDGRTWACATPQSPWAPRCCHFLVDYRGRLWLVGGDMGANGYATDLWSTSDGKNWRQEIKQFAWPPRHGNGIVVFKNKVWIVGGTFDPLGKSSRNDVWSFEAGDTPRVLTGA